LRFWSSSQNRRKLISPKTSRNAMWVRLPAGVKHMRPIYSDIRRIRRSKATSIIKASRRLLPGLSIGQCSSCVGSIMSRPLPSGIYTPLPTFFDDNEDIDFESFQKHVVYTAKAGTFPVISGSAGEAAHLVKAAISRDFDRH
jgi:pyridoxal biosynthesis lyase PdxS